MATEPRPFPTDPADPTSPDSTSRPAQKHEEGDARPAQKHEEGDDTVLHTRVSAALEQELRSMATSLQIPVSKLVRAVLEDVVEAADRAGERVESELQKAARTVHDESENLAERVESGLHGAARKMHRERDRLLERLELGIERAAESLESSEDFATRLTGVVERAARRVQSEGQTWAERVESGLERIVEQLKRGAGQTGPVAGVIAFQPVILAAEVRCAECKRQLGIGQRAALGITEDPSQKIFVCDSCLPTERSGEGGSHDTA